jgi:hypothetical protein
MQRDREAERQRKIQRKGAMKQRGKAEQRIKHRGHRGGTEETQRRNYCGRAEEI